MELPPSYYAILSPPTYEASVHAAQQEQESIWPRDYERSTPRIDVVRFYHNLVLSCPDETNPFLFHEDDGNHDRCDQLLPHVSTSPSLLFDHHHTVTELNQVLLRTWVRYNIVPSYEAFKAKIQSYDLRPIPNRQFESL